MSLIIKLGENRGEIYRNGELSIEPELWDKLVVSFEMAWNDDDEEKPT